MKTNILLWTILSLLAASCSKDEGMITDIEKGEPLEIETAMQGFMDAEKPGTRAIVSAGKTTFKVGDFIGVFAMKNGALISDCNNVKLAYQGSGVWKGQDVYDYGGGVTYFAYYPYNAEMNSKTSLDAIKDAFVLSEVQNTPDLLAANDLMTATGTMSSGKLTFNFTHALCLLEFYVPKDIKFEHYGSYYNFYHFSYHYDIIVADICIGRRTPYKTFTISTYRADGDLYRCIIPPMTLDIYDTNLNIGGNIFQGGGQMRNMPTTSYTSGNYYRINIKMFDGIMDDGDFFYNDGTIMPASATVNLDAANCVGIMVNGGICYNEKLAKAAVNHQSNALKGVVHGYVLSLHDIPEVEFGPRGSKLAMTTIDGYDTTMLFAQNGYAAAQATINYKGVLPSIPNSGWFIPDFMALYLDDRDEGLNKVGGTLLRGGYWKPIELGEDKALVKVVRGTDAAYKNEKRKVRPMFAF